MAQTSQEESKICNVISKSLCELSSASLPPFYHSDFFSVTWKHQECHCLWVLLVSPALALPKWLLFRAQGCFFRSIVFSQTSFAGFENRHSLCGPFPCCAFISSISHHQSYFRFYLHNFCLPLEVKFYERGIFVLCSLFPAFLGFLAS